MITYLMIERGPLRAILLPTELVHTDSSTGKDTAVGLAVALHPTGDRLPFCFLSCASFAVL